MENARRNAEWMMCDVLACSRAVLYANIDAPMSRREMETFSGMVARRAGREPLQYILGYTEFFGLRIRVSPDVLIPRPETEQVVEHALAELRADTAPRVLDVGTGSGCIALAIKSALPNARVLACDVSPEALALAERNAIENRLDVDFILLDALSDEFPEQAPVALDLIISNPPYVAEEEANTLSDEIRRHEPHIALFAPRDPLIFYDRISAHAKKLLRSGGRLVFETHAEYGPAAADLLHERGFGKIELHSDYAGHPRILSAYLP